VTTIPRHPALFSALFRKMKACATVKSVGCYFQSTVQIIKLMFSSVGCPRWCLECCNSISIMFSFQVVAESCIVKGQGVAELLFRQESGR